MRKLNYQNLSVADSSLQLPFNFNKLALICLIVLAGAGCKKVNEDRDYGYAKIVVKCEKKCDVLYGSAEKMNKFDVDANTATYYQRYQRNYNLDISITPVDADQSIDLSVYSREEKQIFHNAVVRKSNVLWNSKIVVP